jgi:biotin carboxyl carrier protein
MNTENKVLSEIIDKKIWFKVDEQIFCYDIVELSQSSFAKSKSKVKSPDKILAPMPGKITKIFVKPNQEVKKGDALIVMEAMKMEYTLKSDIDSSVENVTVQMNDQVALGHLLIQLKVPAK